MTKKEKPVLPKLEIPEIKKETKLERKENAESQKTIQIEKDPKGKGKKNKQ